MDRARRRIPRIPQAVAETAPRLAATFGVHPRCVATACGVGLAHTGFRIPGFQRRDAILAAGLVGLSPGIRFYATVLEMHALLFGIAGL